MAMRNISFRWSKQIALFLLLSAGIFALAWVACTLIRPPKLPVLQQKPTLQPVTGDWWKPAPGTSWQWQLSGKIDPSLDVQMYDIDLFDASQQVIDQLHMLGRVVICYFSAGTHEDWRPDRDSFPASLLGNPLPDWPGERWLDIRQIDELGPIISGRLELAAQKSCDGVEPDNVDAYQNDSSFRLSYADQLDYNIWLAQEAHARGLSVGLKNNLEQVNVLEPYFDWALIEECFSYQECELLSPFVAAGKAVFGVEYSLDPADFCPQANALDFDFLAKHWELDAWRQACR
jgi:hypothetical protein